VRNARAVRNAHPLPPPGQRALGAAVPVSPATIPGGITGLPPGGNIQGPYPRNVTLCINTTEYLTPPTVNCERGTAGGLREGGTGSRALGTCWACAGPATARVGRGRGAQHTGCCCIGRTLF
jgi:hypothetical protein